VGFKRGRLKVKEFCQRGVLGLAYQGHVPPLTSGCRGVVNGYGRVTAKRLRIAGRLTSRPEGTCLR
jgi:hypothetical protein